MLRIHHNLLDQIANDAFANLTHLKKIYGSNNQLEYWNREWFSDSRALEIMDFQNNKIRLLPRRAFEAMPKLKQIYFDDNEIRTIQADAFKGLTYLEYLGLRNNRLKEINENIFPNKLKVRTMLISANYLNYLENEVLKKVSVKEIELEFNPWKCSCLDRIYYWLYKTNATKRHSKACFEGKSAPECAVPKTYSHTCLEYVDDELTQRYIKVLKDIASLPRDHGCAQLLD